MNYPNSLRAVHVLSGLYNIVYVYSDLRNLQYSLSIVRYVTLPALLITGFLLVRCRKKRVCRK